MHPRPPTGGDCARVFSPCRGSGGSNKYTNMISPHGPQAISARKVEEQDSSLIPASIILFVVGVLIPAALAYSFSVNNEYVVLAVVLGFIGGVLIMAVPHLGLAFFTGLLYIRPEESITELAGMRLTL